MTDVPRLYGFGLMPRRVQRLVGGGGVKARALRGSFWTLTKFGGENVLRLVSNLILTRLLFPEAFGMMAIVHVFVAGLQMFSDTGIRASIIQNPRGDDPAFLNTAWTIQVGRGVLLWLGAAALAIPAAAIYDEPMLLQLLPVAGVNALISGFNPTAVYVANRHLMLGRVTAINLATQAAVIVIMVVLALIFRSVWALVLGGVAGSVIRLGLLWWLMPGPSNRFGWDRAAASDLFHFGKYMFLGTAAGFVINHADRAILGGFVPFAVLGIYSIGYFMASVPQSVQQALVSRIVFPLYRMKAEDGEAGRRKLFRARRMLVATTLTINAAMGFAGVALIGFLYDPRYAAAGPVVVLFSLSLVPRICFGNYSGVLLAHGDSRSNLFLTGSTAVLQTIFLLVGVSYFGMVGAVLAPGLAALMTAPLRVTFAARYGAVDRTDMVFLVVGLVAGVFACWLHLDEILALLP